MQKVNSPPALTADPIRLVEEFPRWLEKVSEKTPGGVILVLDSINRFQVKIDKLHWHGNILSKTHITSDIYFFKKKDRLI